MSKIYGYDTNIYETSIGNITTNNNETLVKVSLPLFEDKELEIFDTHIHEIASEYTKAYMIKKDEILTQRLITKLEAENEELIERNDKLNDENNNLSLENQRLLNRIDKAIEYIEEIAPWREQTKEGNIVSGKLLQDDDIDYVLDILKGE